jgi:hypothetical protein
MSCGEDAKHERGGRQVAVQQADVLVVTVKTDDLEEGYDVR